ncbi:MAG: hypothetical protein EA393_13570, partial [Bacteroidetes bacterium]
LPDPYKNTCGYTEGCGEIISDYFFTIFIIIKQILIYLKTGKFRFQSFQIFSHKKAFQFNWGIIIIILHPEKSLFW